MSIHPTAAQRNEGDDTSARERRQTAADEPLEGERDGRAAREQARGDEHEGLREYQETRA